jgi:hypothetical protein
MGRRRRNSVVPYVVLGAAMSIGVVALTASRFGWRRTKAADDLAPLPAGDDAVAAQPSELRARDDAAAESQERLTVAEPSRAQPAGHHRFAPAVRWDASPEEYAAARTSGDPPGP